jgi:hypothetical protein
LASIYGKSGRPRSSSFSVDVALVSPRSNSHDRRGRRSRISLLDLEAAVIGAVTHVTWVVAGQFGGAEIKVGDGSAPAGSSSTGH